MALKRDRREEQAARIDLLIEQYRVSGEQRQERAAEAKKRTEAAWPAGRYSATYRVTRDGAEVLRKTFEVEARAR